MTRPWLAAALVAVAVISGCDPRRRVVIATGTTLGLKATPGDGESRPPQVTLGYKRAELALVPTRGEPATGGSKRCAVDRPGVDIEKCTDAFSTLTAFDFRTRWFGATELSSFLSTGFAAREIQMEAPAAAEGAPAAASTAAEPNAFMEEFGKVFEEATVGPSSETELERKKALQEKRRALSEPDARKVLEEAGFEVRARDNAKNALQVAIARASEGKLKQLEDVMTSLGF